MDGPLKLGFVRPVQESQAVFRATMAAMARPGSIRGLPVDLDPPAGLRRAAAALALALCDFETPVWLDPTLAENGEVKAFLRFHTGAPVVTDAAAAQFAFLGRGAVWPAFETFCLGTLDNPDRSTTLVAEVDSLVAGTGFALAGPGIDGRSRLEASPLPHDIRARLAENRSLFPRGIDLMLTCRDSLAALPRSVTVED
jgi:alpha-D-ribose 1-methylphosphonate 5-triphosphate synthase subunit PhnH